VTFAAGQLSRLNEIIEAGNAERHQLIVWLVVVSAVLAILVGLVVFLFWSMTRPESDSPRVRWVRKVEEDLEGYKPILVKVDRETLDGIYHGERGAG